MNIASIYQQIPADVKEALIQKALHRVGSLILDKEGKIYGFLQSSTDYVEENKINDILANAAQYAQLGIQANPIAFGVHAAGSFSVLAYHIEAIKDRLENMAKVLEKVNAKVDIGYYAKFRAAIELSSHAFSMENPKNKLSMAHKAIQLFVETKNIYTQYLEQELEGSGRTLSDYFLITVLSYLGQVKCCLELEEIQTAKKILIEGTEKTKAIAVKYIRQLLSENPAIYLHNDFKETAIDLSRLVKVYKWLGEEIDENQLFNELRTAFINSHVQPEKALKALPKIVWNPALDIETKDKHLMAKLNPLTYLQSEDTKPFMQNRLKESFETIEQIMEAYNRFYSAVFEVETIARSGGTYQEWKKKLAENNKKSDELLYVALKKPVPLTIEK